MLGILGFAMVLGRAINVGGGPFLVALFFLTPIGLILFPYFWELFAFREMVEIENDIVMFRTINYTENSFIKFSHKVVDKFTGSMGDFQDDD